MEKIVNLILNKYLKQYQVPDYALSANLKDLRNLINPKKHDFIGSYRWRDNKYTLALAVFKELLGKEIEMPDINKKLDQMMLIIIDMKKDLKEVKEDVGVLKEDVSVLKEDVKVLKEDVKVLKEDMVIVKADIKVLKEDMTIVKSVPIIKAAFENQ